MARLPTLAARSAGASDRYDDVSIGLHWFTAIFVILLFCTSLVWNYLTPHDRFWRPLMEGTHESLGTLFSILILVRIFWRPTMGRRVPPETGLSGVLSTIMYWVLYLLLAAEVVFGFVLRWLQGEKFSFFGAFSTPALLSPDRALADTFEHLHNYTGWAIVILSFGHAAAALVHRYWFKDSVLHRMMFRRGPT